MIRPHLEYIDYVIDSCTKDKIDKIDKLENRALRRIEYCLRPDLRLEYLKLRMKYNIEQLEIRRERSLLRIMYDMSKDRDNIQVIKHDIQGRIQGGGPGGQDTPLPFGGPPNFIKSEKKSRARAPFST